MEKSVNLRNAAHLELGRAVTEVASTQAFWQVLGESHAAVEAEGGDGGVTKPTKEFYG